MFARDFRKNGTPGLTTYMTEYKVGDIVDVKGTGFQQKGMPHKVYHGKTGRIFNVSRRAVGVMLNKRIKNRVLAKRVNIRVEHVKHSKSRLGHLARAAENEAIKAKATENKEKATGLKRQPKAPRVGHFVNTKFNPVEEVRPIAFDFLF